MKIAETKTVPLTNEGINAQLILLQSVLEGRLGSENIRGNESRSAEIPSSLVSDFPEAGRPVTGLKFFGHTSEEDSFSDSIFDVVLRMAQRNMLPQTITARTAFVLNPDNTEYAPSATDETGTLVSKANMLRQEQSLVFKLANNQRVVTKRRLKELQDKDAFSFADQQVVPSDLAYDFFASLTRSHGGHVQLPGILNATPGGAPDDTPIISWKVYRETDMTVGTGRVSCAVMRDTIDEFVLSLSLCLLTGLPKDKFFTLIVEADLLVEEIL